MAVISVRGSTDGTAPRMWVAGRQTTVTGIVVHREKILSSSFQILGYTRGTFGILAQSPVRVKMSKCQKCQG